MSALHFLYVITDNDSQCWDSAWPASHHLQSFSIITSDRPATESTQPSHLLYSAVCEAICTPMSIPGLVPRWSVVMSVPGSQYSRCQHLSSLLSVAAPRGHWVLTVAPCYYQARASNEISGLMTNYMFYVRGDKKFNVYQHRLQQLVLS